MTKQEMYTITQAMLKKQTWIRKELSDFLDIWREITKDPISGHDTFVLFEYSSDEQYPITHRICLRRGVSRIDGDFGYDEWHPFDNYLDVSTMSISRVKKIINAIHAGLAKYFKNIQSDIENLDEIGMRNSAIIKKLI